MKEPHTALFIAPTGVGKTHLALSLLENEYRNHFNFIVIISWLTVSSQIVKSLSLPYKKFYFFNMVQPIDLIFCKMVDIIEQNIFNRADFLFRS